MLNSLARSSASVARLQIAAHLTASSLERACCVGELCMLNSRACSSVSQGCKQPLIDCSSLQMTMLCWGDPTYRTLHLQLCGSTRLQTATHWTASSLQMTMLCWRAPVFGTRYLQLCFPQGCKQLSSDWSSMRMTMLCWRAMHIELATCSSASSQSCKQLLI